MKNPASSLKITRVSQQFHHKEQEVHSQDFLPSLAETSRRVQHTYIKYAKINMAAGGDT